MEVALAEGGEEGREVFLGFLFGFPHVRIICISIGSEKEALLEDEKKRKEKKRREKKGV